MPVAALFMVGNAHLDPVWLWRWPEGYREVLDTFRSALDRLREYPEFVFTSSSAAFYEWVEEADPAMLAEIRQRVAEGRWHIAGGWWIQPDCNIPSGESFVRQALIGQRFFRRVLGVSATVGYNPDSFGHAATLPQILRKSGLTSYVFMRPGPHEMELPGRAFVWEGPDGSRVTAFRIIDPYCAWPDMQEAHIANCAAQEQAGVDAMMCFYGVGNHGGGPTRENLDGILAHRAARRAPSLRFSHPAAYFAGLNAAALPVHAGELQHHAPGCYSAHSGIKRDNRRAEGLLLDAETFCAIAHRETGMPWPDLSRAWKGVLFNQFHDVLGGTSLPEAYDDAAALHGEAISVASRARNVAIQRIAGGIDLPPADGTPIVLFNPHSWKVRATVEVEIDAQRGHTIRTEGRAAVPSQLVRSHAITTGRARVAFRADVPPLGWTTCRLIPGTPAPRLPMSAGDLYLENGRLRVDVDPATGLVTLRGRGMGAPSVLNGAAGVVLDDTSDTWSHGVTRFDREAGRFEPTSIRLVEHGPVLSAIRVESRWGESRLAQTFTLAADADHVLVDVEVDWRERRRMLRLEFPTGLNAVTATFSATYGHVVRPAIGDEEPSQEWIDVTGVTGQGDTAGLSILNDGKYSASVRGGTACLTVLRSPAYAHHDPATIDAEGPVAWMDQGPQAFRYALLPHAGDWRSAETVRRAAELNRPTVALMAAPQLGSLPPEAACGATNKPNVAISALKRAEDGDGYIVRAWETAGQRTTARLMFQRWDRDFEADFAPLEVKTYLAPDDPGLPVREVNLIEDPVDGGQPSTGEAATP